MFTDPISASPEVIEACNRYFINSSNILRLCEELSKNNYNVIAEYLDNMLDATRRLILLSGEEEKKALSNLFGMEKDYDRKEV